MVLAVIGQCSESKLRQQVEKAVGKVSLQECSRETDSSFTLIQFIGTSVVIFFKRQNYVAVTLDRLCDPRSHWSLLREQAETAGRESSWKSELAGVQS